MIVLGNTFSFLTICKPLEFTFSIDFSISKGLIALLNDI